MIERIKELRKKLNLTQGEFAEKIRLGHSTLGMMEVGKRDINDRHIKLICDTFNVNEEWLRTGDGEMFISKSLDDEFYYNLGYYGKKLTDIQKVIINEYLKVSPEAKEEITKFIRNVAEKINQINND